MTMKMRALALILAGGIYVLPSCQKEVNTNNPPDPPPDTTTVVKTMRDTTGVEYGVATDWQGNSYTLKRDLYYPEGAKADQRLPLVVLSHPGEFLEGDKSDLKNSAELFADSGYVAASINFRLGWDKGSTLCGGDSLSMMAAGYRALQDLHAALRFLVAKYDQYAIDTSRIFLSGISSGGMLSLNLPFLDPTEIETYYPGLSTVLGGLDKSGNTLTNHFTIKAAASRWGALVDSTIITSSNAIPVILFHGADAPAIPLNVRHFLGCPNYPELYGSQFAYDKITSSGKGARLFIMNGEAHDPPSYTQAFASKEEICFFRSVLENRVVTGVSNGTTSACQ